MLGFLPRHRAPPIALNINSPLHIARLKDCNVTSSLNAHQHSIAATPLPDTLFWTVFQGLFLGETRAVVTMKSFRHKTHILENSFLSFHELFSFVRNC